MGAGLTCAAFCQVEWVNSSYILGRSKPASHSHMSGFPIGANTKSTFWSLCIATRLKSLLFPAAAYASLVFSALAFRQKTKSFTFWFELCYSPGSVRFVLTCRGAEVLQGALLFLFRSSGIARFILYFSSFSLKKSFIAIFFFTILKLLRLWCGVICYLHFDCCRVASLGAGVILVYHMHKALSSVRMLLIIVSCIYTVHKESFQSIIVACILTILHGRLIL